MTYTVVGSNDGGVTFTEIEVYKKDSFGVNSDQSGIATSLINLNQINYDYFVQGIFAIVCVCVFFLNGRKIKKHFLFLFEKGRVFVELFTN